MPFEHLDPVDVAFDLAGAVGQGQAVEDGLVVAFEPGDEGAQVRLVAGAGLGDPRIQLLAAQAGEDLGELGDVAGQGVQVRALGPDAGEAGLLVVVQGGGVAQDPARDMADLGRRRDGGRRGLGLEGPQVGIDGAVAAAVPLRGDLPVQLADVGAPGVPALVQEGL